MTPDESLAIRVANGEPLVQPTLFETSREAAASIDPTSLRATVFAVLLALGKHGATCDEIEERTGMKHQTVGPRLLELRKLGLVVAAMKEGLPVERKTRSGRSAVVWVAVEQQR